MLVSGYLQVSFLPGTLSVLAKKGKSMTRWDFVLIKIHTLMHLYKNVELSEMIDPMLEVKYQNHTSVVHHTNNGWFGYSLAT